MTTRVAVIGNGQMGLVMADALVAAGAEVRLWGPFPEHLQPLAETRESPERLPGFRLPDAVDVVADDGVILDGAELILNAIPAQHTRKVWARLAGFYEQAAPGEIICVSKGIENSTLMRPTEVIGQALAGRHGDPAAGGDADGAGEGRLCALSGPTIAAELARHLPATMVAASPNESLRKRVQELFGPVPWLRVYRNPDITGVEVAGAAKNVIALAAGMIDGLEIGDNAKSALLARGLAEIARLGEAMGALRETFYGVAGVGDLATTCFSPSGRNRTCGERIGRGETLEDILTSTVHVVEGVPTSRAMLALAERHEVEMPISQSVSDILFRNLDPREAIDQLMSRAPKAERV